MKKGKRGQRKAQVSLFMILAALLLLGGILWFTMVEVSEQDTSFVPQDIKPVHEYISRCLYDATEPLPKAYLIITNRLGAQILFLYSFPSTNITKPL